MKCASPQALRFFSQTMRQANEEQKYPTEEAVESETVEPAAAEAAEAAETAEVSGSSCLMSGCTRLLRIFVDIEFDI